MNAGAKIRDERGIALVAVLFLSIIVASVSAMAAMVGTSSRLINRYANAQSVLEAVADAGIEVARSKINGNASLYPDSAYATFESGANVYDADGAVIPNVTRSIYVGPSGVTTGQYGVFGSIVSVVEDHRGNRVVRRGEVAQESFAKFAYFTDIEPSNISFGGGDQIAGPVHTNDFLKIYSSGATFLGDVETARTVQGGQYGRFARGYTEHAPFISMPNTADLGKLRSQAQAGNTYVAGNTNGSVGAATTRIEFVAIDIDGDGQTNGSNEGFMMVYRSNDANWVVADYGGNNQAISATNRNCGWFSLPGRTGFVSRDAGATNAQMKSATRRCFLGGTDSLFGAFTDNDGIGAWLPFAGVVNPAVLAAAPTRAAYLWPINRQFNPSFKGVIFIDGKVAISGRLRGQVTLAATNDIIVADDVMYVTNAGAGTCADILGIFAGDDVIVSDNAINSPVRPYTTQNHLTYDDTKDEFIDGVILALDIFTVENYNTGSTNDEACETQTWGRGCLYLTGGIIQRTRGAVGTGSGTGGKKRYSYDQCAYSNPPPYFPTTGHFARGRYFEVDPTGFAIGQYWSLLTPR